MRVEPRLCRQAPGEIFILHTSRSHGGDRRTSAETQTTQSGRSGCWPKWKVI